MSLDPLLLFKLLRHNPSDLEDVAKIIDKWNDEMKKKDAEIAEEDTKDFRNKKKVQQVASEKSKSASQSKLPTKLGATDFAAWHKFDVDAEFKNLEDDNDDSELTDEHNDSIYDEAVLEKEKGNKFVKAQKWHEAIKCYSKAISYYSYDPIFYANRALCYLKKKRYQEAERDCDLSLHLDKTYVKALQRRAAARIELKKFEQAEEDLLSVLSFEPKNTESKKELERLRNLMGKKEEKPVEQRPISEFPASKNKSKKPTTSTIRTLTPQAKSDIKESPPEIDTSKPSTSWPTQEDIIMVKPINKQPHLRSKKPLMIIEIKEQVENKKESIETSSNKEKTSKKEKTKTISSLPNRNRQSYSTDSDDLKVVEKKNLKGEKNTSNNNLINKINDSAAQDNSKRNVSVSEAKTKKHILDDGPQKFEKPTTWEQFHTFWNKLRTSQLQYAYLKSIDPLKLKRIFWFSLDSKVFSRILEVVAENCVMNKDPVFDIMDGLSRVYKFELLVISMTYDDKYNAWNIIDHIREMNEVDKDELIKLVINYNLLSFSADSDSDFSFRSDSDFSFLSDSDSD